MAVSELRQHLKILDAALAQRADMLWELRSLSRRVLANRTRVTTEQVTVCT